MSEEHKTIIIRQKAEIVDRLIPAHYKAELESLKIINESESDYIFGRNCSNRDQCEALVSILIKGTDSAYYKFGKLLCDKGKKHLAKLLIGASDVTEEGPCTRKGE